MRNPFQYFDKVYVISDKNNFERREYMQEILSGMKIEFEFYDAIIGKDLSKEEISKVYDPKKAQNHKTIKRSLSKPEIGCALSHINIYKRIVKQNLNNALIFEDDIKPNYEVLDYVDNAIKELPEDWDLLHFGTLNHYAKQPPSRIFKLLFYYPLVKIFTPQKMEYKYNHLWNFYPRDYSKSLRRAGYHQGCQAYAISQRGAKKFLSYHDKIVTPMDYMLSVMIIENELNAFITKKLIFCQNKRFESSIESSRKIHWQKKSKAKHD